MRFNEAAARVMVRKDYGKCFDFYTEKLGLVPTWGDRNGPYTSFAAKEGEPNCFAIFSRAGMSAVNGYAQPEMGAQQDTMVITLPTDDVARDYKLLKEKGVEFVNEPQAMEDWGGPIVAYFRDPEGNLIELTDGST